MGIAPAGPATGNIITIANPAAGAQFQYIVPANTTIHLTAVFFFFLASAAPASRHINITVDDGTDVYYISTFVDVLAANENGYFIFSQHQHSLTFIPTFATMLSLSPFLIIPAGHRINSSIDNINATDQLSSIRLQTQRYIA